MMWYEFKGTLINLRRVDRIYLGANPNEIVIIQGYHTRSLTYDDEAAMAEAWSLLRSLVSQEQEPIKLELREYADGNHY
jgi:hypothetical protein